MGCEISNKNLKNILFLIAVVKISQAQYVASIKKKVVKDLDSKAFFLIEYFFKKL